MNYPINRKAVSYKTDSSGTATLTAWKPGESGELFYEWKGKVGESQFKVGQDREVSLTLGE